ncbi:hypothetical protein I312_103775 [Cryptococcus bacillisporus CA1280]|uniref:uncharacterized protein n=1 Tax=Cryptococcus bacillisporus CA1280 TaxID=1296109 RepID=UPI0033672F08
MIERQLDERNVWRKGHSREIFKVRVLTDDMISSSCSNDASNAGSCSNDIMLIKKLTIPERLPRSIAVADGYGLSRLGGFYRGDTCIFDYHRYTFAEEVEESEPKSQKKGKRRRRRAQ